MSDMGTIEDQCMNELITVCYPWSVIQTVISQMSDGVRLTIWNQFFGFGQISSGVAREVFENVFRQISNNQIAIKFSR